MIQKKEDYAHWLCGIQGLGIRKLFALQEVFGTPEKIFCSSEEELARVSGIGSKMAHQIAESRQTFCPKKMREEWKRYGISCYTFFDTEYPDSCRQIFHPPKRLFWRGKFPDNRLRLAIVGARRCSVYGQETARHFAAVLAGAGVQIISGMARGIDGWAHQGAMEGGGDTYAVLGNSVEICYPMEHRKLYESICKRGGVLSEYPLGTRARAAHFPMRNRIISGLSEGILVVEAREKSGSLITADAALEQGKDVFVIPGRIGDELSKGCNQLIRQGAFLVTSPEEILEFYGVEQQESGENVSKINIYLESEEKMVYASLSLEPKHMTDIAQELNMDSILVMRCVLNLLKSRLIKEIGNHYYIRNNS